MTISDKKVVSVNYHLTSKTDKGEELVEKTDKDHPFVFLYGSGGLLEDFEKNLKGKKVGDAFDFHIEAAKGYGLRDESYVVNIPSEAFKGEDGKIDTETIQVGSNLPMVDNEGNRMEGLVLEITPEFIRMDFNHPLAGQNLHFSGEVLEIRDATAEELSHGHVHGPGGHHHH
jgi:FKBP-type peptidyl-prolyl cis-trans isomerase SlyD